MNVVPLDHSNSDRRDEPDIFTTALSDVTETLGGEALLLLLSGQRQLEDTLRRGGAAQMGLSRGKHFFIEPCCDIPREHLQTTLTDVARRIGKNIQVVLTNPRW